MRGPPASRTLRQLLSFGVVNLDKPPGPSAHQVAGWVRDLVADAYGTLPAGTDGREGDNGTGDEGCRGGVHEPGTADGVDRAAHAGTLDPKVTGCLPVLLGDATRLAQVFLEGAKEYVAVLELHGPAPADVESTVAEFEGSIYQKPPRKSAVTRRLRTREIHDIEMLESTEDRRQVLLRVRCESGTYVRKLCHDLGLALGTGGHMGDLRRTAVVPFDDTDLVTLHDLADALEFAREGDPEPLREAVVPAERALSHLPGLVIAASAAEQVAHGAPVYAPGVLGVGDRREEGDGWEEGRVERGDLLACYTPDGAAVCLGRLVGDPDAERGEVVDLERVLV